jgi:ATP-dependent RNA helicase DDX54/DBP10
MNLKSEVYRGIITKGFKQPTSIQKKIIPYILEGRDVVGCSKTGSGKTAAFVIPMIDKLEKHSNIVGVRALIVSPTRELAIQTSLVVRQLAKYTDLTHSLLIGGHQFEG